MNDTSVRWLLATACIAGLTHIAAVLLIPGYARDNAFAGLGPSASAGQLVRVDDRDALADLDPAFVNAVCRFDADTGPVRLSGPMPSVYWSVVALSDDGRILATLARDDMRGRDIDVLIGKTATIDTTRQTADLSAIEVLSLPVDTGFVLVRLFAGGLDSRAAATATLAGFTCQPALPD